jgi:hypothetical protein
MPSLAKPPAKLLAKSPPLLAVLEATTDCKAVAAAGSAHRSTRGPCDGGKVQQTSGSSSWPGSSHKSADSRS